MNYATKAEMFGVTLPKNIGLLNLYKIEKSQMDLPSDPFPPFNEWKAEYMEEYIDSHMDSEMVDAETAIELTEKEIEADDAAVMAQKPATVPVPPKPVKYKTIKTVKQAKPKAEKVNKVSKTELAESIYKSMMVGDKHPERKAVIERFVAEVGLTSSGASTYHYNIKKKLS